MCRITTLVAVIFAALATLPAWGQANLTPDPVPRLPVQPGQSSPAEDVEFLKAATAMSRVENQLGAVAKNVSLPELRDLSGRIADHHRALEREIAKLAQERRVDLSQANLAVPNQGGPGGAASAVTSPQHVTGAQAQQATERLSGLRGDALNRGLVQEQLKLHDRLVDLYQTQASHTADGALASFAIKKLVVIQRDRDELRQFARQLGVGVDEQGQARQYGAPERARK